MAADANSKFETFQFRPWYIHVFPKCCENFRKNKECIITWARLSLQSTGRGWSYTRRHVAPWAVKHDDVIKWKHFPRYWPFVSPVNSSQRPVTRRIDVFFDLCLNKRLSKQWYGWWFEMTSCPLWRHCNDNWLKLRIFKGSSTLTEKGCGQDRKEISFNRLARTRIQDVKFRPSWYQVCTPLCIRG